MAKKQRMLSKVVTFIAWLTGVIVSLSVGLALIDETLKLPSWLGSTGVGIAQTAGWIVVLTTIVGAGLALVDKLR